MLNSIGIIPILLVQCIFLYIVLIISKKQISKILYKPLTAKIIQEIEHSTKAKPNETQKNAIRILYKLRIQDNTSTLSKVFIAVNCLLGSVAFIVVSVPFSMQSVVVAILLIVMLIYVILCETYMKVSRLLLV